MPKSPLLNNIEGKFVNFREVEVSDAKFILELRINPKKDRYINKIENNLQKQIDYIKHYKTLQNEWYYIVERKDGTPLGTNSIYPYPIFTEQWKDTKGYVIDDSQGMLSPGRWVMSDESSVLESLESDYLIKKLFFEHFPYDFAAQIVHKDNTRVLNFHKNWGSVEIGFEDSIDHIMLNFYKENFLKNKSKFERMLYGK